MILRIYTSRDRYKSGRFFCRFCHLLKARKERSGSVNAFTFNSPFLSVQNHLVDFQLVIYVHSLIRLALHHKNCCIHRMTDSFLHLCPVLRTETPEHMVSKIPALRLLSNTDLDTAEACVPVIAMMLLIPL